MKIKNILLPTDFSPCAESAIPQAVFLTRESGALLHLFHAVECGGIPAVDEVRLVSIDEEFTQRMESTARYRLEHALKGHRTSSLPIVRVHRRCMSAAPEILSYAKNNHIDLIIMGTHGWRGFRHLVLGSVTEELIRLAPCPVLSIRQTTTPKPPPDTERILVPIDFSPYSLKALDLARNLAQLYDAHLQLLYVVQPPLLPSFYVRSKKGMLQMDELLNHAEQELLRCNSEAEGPDIPIEIHVQTGRAASTIIRFAAEENSDMIVMTTHGMTGMKYFLIGSVAQKVIQRAPCPVLTLKPKPKGATALPLDRLDSRIDH
ncbi:MAG: universal stress protein [bacterium]